MFPVGGAGIGLLILRLCAAGMLLRNLMVKSTVDIPFWEAAGLIVLAISLSSGAFTHLGCITSVLAHMAMLLSGVEARSRGTRVLGIRNIGSFPAWTWCLFR